MIRLKHSVKLDCIKPEILVGLMVAYSVFREFGHDCILTSVNDSTHSKKSLHYEGLAIDLRSRHIESTARKMEILGICKTLMDKQFDIILEGLDTPNEHYHLEYDPK